jgi:hypothetical protein
MKWRFNANLSFRTIRFEHKIFCSFHADHLHVALAFRREGTDLKISKYKMIEAPELTQAVCRRNGIFGIVGLRMSAYAKNSLCAYVPILRLGVPLEKNALPWSRKHWPTR